MVAAAFTGLAPKTRWALLGVAAALLLGPIAVLLMYPALWRRPAVGTQDCAALAASREAPFMDLVNCSQTLLAQHRELESLPVLQRAAALQPASAIVHNNLCVAYGLLQDRERAVRECTLATSLEPKFELARNNLRWVSQIGAGGAQ